MPLSSTKSTDQERRRGYEQIYNSHVGNHDAHLHEWKYRAVAQLVNNEYMYACVCVCVCVCVLCMCACVRQRSDRTVLFA